MKIAKINGKEIGHYYQEVDGFYKFLPDIPEHPGYWDEYTLMCIMYDLRVLNADWDLHIMTDPKITNLSKDPDRMPR